MSDKREIADPEVEGGYSLMIFGRQVESLRTLVAQAYENWLEDARLAERSDRLRDIEAADESRIAYLEALERYAGVSFK